MSILKVQNLTKTYGDKEILVSAVNNVSFAVEEKEFSVEQLADLLIKRYGIARELAVRDAASLCEQWVKVGLVE